MVALFVSISLLAINFVFYQGFLWSIIPIGSVLYGWLIVRLGIFSRANTALKILSLTTAAIILLVIVDGLFDQLDWAIEFAAPFLLVACSIAVCIITLVKRIEWRDYVIYLFTLAILGFAPILFYYFGWTTVVWPSTISTLTSTLIFLGLLIFWSKPLKAEIKKRLHL